jgi:multiple sugar transport system ATP-binding protein
VVLNAGRIEQVGAPLELYNHPQNLFVAGFIGSPKMNFITGAEAEKHGCATLGVRPEHVVVSADGPWQGSVGLAEHLGSDTFLKVDVSGIGVMTVRAGGEMQMHSGDKIRLGPQPGKIYRFGADGKAV